MSAKPNLLPPDAPKVHFRLVEAWLNLNSVGAPPLSKFDVVEWSSDLHECFIVHQVLAADGSLTLQFGETTALSFTRSGGNVSGRMLSDVLDRFVLEWAERAFHNSLRRREPYYSEHISSQFGRGYTHFKRLSLPVADDNGSFRAVFGSAVRVQD